MQKHELHLILYPMYTTRSKLNIHLNVESKIIKLLEENIGEKP